MRPGCDRSLAATIGIDMPIGLPEDRTASQRPRGARLPRRPALVGVPDTTSRLPGRTRLPRCARAVARASSASGSPCRPSTCCRRSASSTPWSTRRATGSSRSTRSALPDDERPGAAATRRRPPAGAARRSELLARVFGTLPTCPAEPGRDDLHDAYAVLWSTDRFVRGVPPHLRRRSARRARPADAHRLLTRADVSASAERGASGARTARRRRRRRTSCAARRSRADRPCAGAARRACGGGRRSG